LGEAIAVLDQTKGRGNQAACELKSVVESEHDKKLIFSTTTMNGRWSKCKSLLAAVAVVVMLEAVMVWKKPASMPSGASSVSQTTISLSLNDSTSEGINAIPSVEKRTDEASENNTANDVSKAATPQIAPVVDENNNYHGVSTNSSVSKLAARQIQNYKDGKGIILNIHSTHHGGTFLCQNVGYAAGTRGGPSFACMGVRPQDNITIEFPPFSWKHNDTANNIELVRPFFHFISWEFGRPLNPLKDTDWGKRNLVSVIVVREPISRLLAGNGMFNGKYPAAMLGEHNDTEYENQWWKYATTEHVTNNYALSVLSTGCCQHNQTDAKHLEAAKQLLCRFTLVLDIRCLDEGVEAMNKILEIKQEERVPRPTKKTAHASSSDRIRLREVYDYLLDSNKLDIQLYEWSKNISLVRCDDLPPKD
jgi:hypothetical protein